MGLYTKKEIKERLDRLQKSLSEVVQAKAFHFSFDQLIQGYEFQINHLNKLLHESTYEEDTNDKAR